MRQTFTLSLLLAASALSARQISPDEARHAADAFLNSKSLVHVEAASGLTRSDAQPYYVFNAADNQGFVIISGDDRYSKVLGYSDRGSFNPNHMPPQLKAMLDNFAERSAKPSNWNSTHPSWNTTFSTRAEEGVLLETAKWGQDAPYNAETPMFDGEHAPTGCVATAMAIVMKYHNWPETYNWDAMPMEIEYDGENPPAPNPELARLMKDAGEAVKMEYGSFESGANVGWISRSLQQVFKYSPDCQIISKKNFLEDEWLKMLKSNIDSKNPVIYNGIGSGNHVFIIDGYKADEYHVNWGWDGWYDGYYSLEALTPNEAQDFSKNQAMIMNIVPDKSGKEYSDCFIDSGYIFAGLPMSLNISVETVKPGETFHVGGVSPVVPANFDGELGIALVSENGDIKEVLSALPYYNSESKAVGFSWAFTDLVINSAVLATDKIQLVSKANGDNKYKLMLGSIENPSWLSVIGNKPVYRKIKLDIKDDIAFEFTTGVNKRTYITVPQGVSEYDVLQGLLFEYSCYTDTPEEDRNITLSLKGKLIYGDQLYSFNKQFGTFFEILGDYEISAQKSILKDYSIELKNAGTLKDFITPEEGRTVRNLTLTGKMNAVDFWYIRDNFPEIKYLDISKIDIEEVKAVSSFVFETSGNNPANVIPEFALQACENLETLLLPESIVGIASDSLGALNLYGVTIPKGVSSIGLNVFFSNRNLQYVCLLNPEPVYINDCVFTGTLCPSEGTLYVPVGSVEKYKEAPVWKEFKNIVEGTLPEIIKFSTTKDGLKYECLFDQATLYGYEEEPVNVVVPESFEELGRRITVTKIKGNIFERCMSLESIVMPNSITEIGECLFWYCENLKEVVLSENIERIPNGSFFGCCNLKDITLSNNVKTIDISAFYATGLEKLSLPKGLTIKKDAFNSLPNLHTVVLNDNLKVEEGIFSYCFNLANFIINSEEIVELDKMLSSEQSPTNINILTSSTSKNFVYSDPCVVFVPGQCADGYKTKADGDAEVREMWRYNINRQQGIFEIVPQMEGLTIDKVTINGNVVAPVDDIYKLDGAATQDIDVEFTLFGHQKMTTHYTSEFNQTVKDAVVTGVGEINAVESVAADVYTIDGLQVLKNASKEQINRLSNGVYILREGTRTRKVVIRN